jgi:hypothetical protein
MPLVGTPELFKTTRTPPPGTTDEIRAKVEEIKANGADRNVDFDFAMPYRDPTIANPLEEVDRHREGLAELEKQGGTWALITRPTGPKNEMLEFIEAFAQTYIK